MDRDYIERHYNDLPTDALLREVLVNAGAFESEALEVIKDVLQRRSGPIGEVITAEVERTGEELDRIQSVRQFIDLRTRDGATVPGQRVDAASGELRLTRRGLGFVSSGREQDPSDSAWLLAGIFGSIAKRVMDTEFATPVEGSSQSLPLSLVARIDSTASWFPAEDIDRIEVRDLRTMTIRSLSGSKALGRLPDGAFETLRSWGEQSGVEVVALESRSLRAWLGGLFGKKSS